MHGAIAGTLVTNAARAAVADGNETGKTVKLPRYGADETTFTGTPERPLGRAAQRETFMLMTRTQPEAAMARLFDRLQAIDGEKDLAWLRA